MNQLFNLGTQPFGIQLAAVHVLTVCASNILHWTPLMWALAKFSTCTTQFEFLPVVLVPFASRGTEPCELHAQILHISSRHCTGCDMVSWAGCLLDCNKLLTKYQLCIVSFSVVKIHSRGIQPPLSSFDHWFQCCLATPNDACAVVCEA